MKHKKKTDKRICHIYIFNHVSGKVAQIMKKSTTVSIVAITSGGLLDLPSG